MFTLKQIAAELENAEIIGDGSARISAMNQLDAGISADELCWCSDKNTGKLRELSRGNIICSRSVSRELLSKSCNYILVDDPRLAFKQAMEKFFVNHSVEFRVEPTATVHASAKLHERVYIGHGVVIEEQVEIGEGSVIGANTVLLRNTKVGKQVKIGCNNTIGGIGFGYVKEADGSYSVIHHIGNVVIEDDVEIGNNTCIDRAVLGKTWIRKNAKIDNLVHIAHGAEIGENSLIIANAMIAGSVRIGKNSWVAPSASILNQKKIGENVTVGMGAVVIKDVEDNDVVAGNPSRSLKK